MLIDDRSIKIDSTTRGRETQLEQRDEDDKIAASVGAARQQVLVINSFCLRE